MASVRGTGSAAMQTEPQTRNEASAARREYNRARRAEGFYQYKVVPDDVKNFFLESDLGPLYPALVNGLEFDADGNLIEGRLVSISIHGANHLNEDLRDTVFGQYGAIAGGNLHGLIYIYAVQHNMFKHAAVNQGKPPNQWNFDKIGVTERFLNTFRRFIPQGEEYDINIPNGQSEGFSLTDLTRAILRKTASVEVNRELYLNTVARPINIASGENRSNVRKYQARLTAAGDNNFYASLANVTVRDRNEARRIREARMNARAKREKFSQLIDDINALSDDDIEKLYHTLGRDNKLVSLFRTFSSSEPSFQEYDMQDY